MCALVDVKSAELRVDRFCDVAATKCSRVCSEWCLCRAELCMLTREEFHRVKNFTAWTPRCRVLYDGLDSCNETLLFPRLKRRGGVGPLSW